MSDKEAEMARVLNAANEFCAMHGSASADDLAPMLKSDSQTVKTLLAALAVRGDLIARPGGLYARALIRNVRLPGSSWKFDLVGPASAARLMGAR